MSGAVFIKGDSEETIVTGFNNEMTLGEKTDVVAGFRGEIVGGAWAEMVGGLKLDLLLAAHGEFVLGPKVEWFYSEYELREWKICNAETSYEIVSKAITIAGANSTTITSPTVNINSGEIKLTSSHIYSPTGIGSPATESQLSLSNSKAVVRTSEASLTLNATTATLVAVGTASLEAGASSVEVKPASLKCNSPEINLNAAKVNIGQPPVAGPSSTPTAITAGGVNWKQVVEQAAGCIMGAKTIIKSM